MTYRHTQIGYTLIAVLGAPIVLFIGVILSHGPSLRPSVVLALLVACLLIFPSLTIEIRDDFLSWDYPRRERYVKGSVETKVS